MSVDWVAVPDIQFDPVRCARLHNQLLAKAIDVSFPALGSPHAVRRDVIPQMRDAAPHWPNDVQIPEDSLLYQFLSLIDVYAEDKLPLTPEMLQPRPFWFDSPLHEVYDDWRFILLYPENTFSEPMNGGLYFDLDTNLVCWGHMDGLGLQNEAFWVPLEVALDEALYMWERGKYVWDTSQTSQPTMALTIRGWVSHDLDEAVAAWDDLIAAIESRLPAAEDAPPLPLQEPLSLDLVSTYGISSFAKAFLTTARRPAFANVAPGVTIFTPESFDALYGSEDPTSWRLTYAADEEGMEQCSLILPATAGAVQQDTSKSNMHFDKDWGSAKKTVSRHAGLYIADKWTGDNADCTWLLAPDGKEEVFSHFGHRPWGKYRFPRLAEILSHWAQLVMEDIWEVGVDGVMSPDTWLSDPETEMYRGLIWTAESQLVELETDEPDQEAPSSPDSHQ